MPEDGTRRTPLRSNEAGRSVTPSFLSPEMSLRVDPLPDDALPWDPVESAEGSIRIGELDREGVAGWALLGAEVLVDDDRLELDTGVVCASSNCPEAKGGI